jgi:serine/threonine protein kinase
MARCPSEQELVDLVTGRMDEPAAVAVHRHIDGCVTCRALLAEMGRATRPALERVSQEVNDDLYEIEARVSSGGLGNIFKARDRRLGRTVAIKQLRGANADSADGVARLRREAEVTARLQHPAIVPVYEAGYWPSGQPFYAMKLVSGRSLQEVIADTHTLEERLALLPKLIIVADAIAYAHAEGVIHRDLKPANILIGSFGETVVIDWGLARLLRETPATDAQRQASLIQESLTAPGAVLGTPAFMPPEQARGEDVDERADVYALGAVLYDLLSGQPPFKGVTPAKIIAQVLQHTPPPIEELAPAISPELAAIVHKAMARQPAERYPTAKELALALERFATGRLVGANESRALVRPGFLQRLFAAWRSRKRG